MTPFRNYRLRRAYRAIEAAERAYSAAHARRDTRAMHVARATLYAARHNALRLEVRSMTAPLHKKLIPHL